jgi:putative tryptophan/tyrosine transport system substrate-binding protein
VASRGPRSGVITLGAVALGLLLGLATPAQASAVLVVLSSDAKPYQEAQAALTEKLKQAQHSVSSIQLKDLTGRGIDDPSVKNAAGVVAVGTEAASWVHEHLPAAVPLTYCLVADPEGAGLTTGTPVRGVSATVPLGDQIDLIRQALPKARALGCLYRSNEERDQRLVKQLRAALPEGWQLKAVAVNEHDSVAAAIDNMLDQKVQAVWTFADAALYNSAMVRALLLAGLRRKVPVFGFSPQFVRAGALLGVGISPAAQGEQAAALAVGQLAAGQLPAGQLPAGPAATQPAANPPPEPPQFQIAVNLIVAEALSLELPGGLIEHAAIVVRKENPR